MNIICFCKNDFFINNLPLPTPPPSPPLPPLHSRSNTVHCTTLYQLHTVHIYQLIQIEISVSYPDPHIQRPPGSGSTWTDTDTFILARNCQLYYLLDSGYGFESVHTVPDPGGL